MGYYSYESPLNMCKVYNNETVYFTNIGSVVQGQNCVLKNKTYTCPATHPDKLDDSICEYRESF